MLWLMFPLSFQEFAKVESANNGKEEKVTESTETEL